MANDEEKLVLEILDFLDDTFGHIRSSCVAYKDHTQKLWPATGKNSVVCKVP